MIIGTFIGMAQSYGYLNAVMLLAVLACLILALSGLVTDRRSMSRFKATMVTKREQQMVWDRNEFTDEMMS